MSSHVAPSEHTRTDPKIGHVVADQRTGDRKLLIYVDDRVVLTRDEAGHTTLTPRANFEAKLGTRYRLRRNADPAIDGGQYDALRDRLAAYEAEDGRKAAHKADALREALDVLAGQAPDDGEEDGADSAADDADPEVDFEEVPGIGPETAGKLRAQGFQTEGDVRTASDEDVLAVSGVGPSALANLREFVD